jgi:hypothetical protein
MTLEEKTEKTMGSCPFSTTILHLNTINLDVIGDETVVTQHTTAC